MITPHNVEYAGEDDASAPPLAPVVLLNKALQNVQRWDFRHESAAEYFRIRAVEITPSTPGDITCPRASMTFICVDASAVFMAASMEQTAFFADLRERLGACANKHMHVHILAHLDDGDFTSYLRLQSTMSAIATSLMNFVQIHPVHSATEVLDIICRLCVLADSNSQTVVQCKIAQLVESLPEMNITLPQNWLPLITMLSGSAENLQPHDCLVIQEGLRSFARIASASVAELRDCSVNKSTATAIRSFFEEEIVI